MADNEYELPPPKADETTLRVLNTLRRAVSQMRPRPGQFSGHEEFYRELDALLIAAQHLASELRYPPARSGEGTI